MQRTMSEVERLRREIGERADKRGPLPREVRERGKMIARTRARAGASPEIISAEIGMSVKTIERWLEPDGKATMLPVRVVSSRARAPEAKAKAAIVVTTVSGLRIEGLDLDSLCTLVSRCG